MLGLKLSTDPRWINLAEKNLSDILTDHAYCEQKAASSCISLIQRYPDRKRLVEELAPIVTEEWGHFRGVLAELKKRNLDLGKQRTDEYVNELKKHERKGQSVEDLLMDRLLVNALIEARSCERFRILSEELEDQNLRIFYRTFMISEAGHYRLFKELAEEYVDKEKVKTRWEELLEIEKNILLVIDVNGKKMH
jgi:tRNA 2-(methylsulfanyl)-N6-isopentenyladenosine37 hydroxylase